MLESPLFHVVTGVSTHPGLSVQYEHNVLNPYEIAQRVLNGSMSKEEPSLEPRRLRINTILYDEVEGIAVGSLEEAEHYVMANSPIPTVEFSNSADPTRNNLSDPLSRTHITSQIVSCGNRIAHRTRRGAGNVLIAGSMVVEELRRLYMDGHTSAFLEYPSPNTVGNWQQIGMFYSTVVVYTGKNVPHDEVHMVYNGNVHVVDGPGVLFDTSNGLSFVETRSGFADSSDFINSFRVKLT